MNENDIKKNILNLQNEFISLYSVSYIQMLGVENSKVCEELFFVKRIVEYTQKSIEIFSLYDYRYMGVDEFDKINYFFKIILIKLKKLGKQKHYSFLKKTNFILNDRYQIKELYGHTKKFSQNKNKILSDFNFIYDEIEELAILNHCEFNNQKDENKFIIKAYDELHRVTRSVNDEIEEFNRINYYDDEDYDQAQINRFKEELKLLDKFNEKTIPGETILEKDENKKLNKTEHISIKMIKNGILGYSIILQGTEKIEVGNKSMWNDLYKLIHNYPQELHKKEYSMDFVSNLNKQTNTLQRKITEILGAKRNILKKKNEMVVLASNIRIVKN